MKHKRFLLGTAVLFLAIALVTYSSIVISRPFAAVTTAITYKNDKISGKQVTLPWPDYGQSALSVNGTAVRLSRSATKATPTASTAKVMTVLAVLDKKPLSGNETGPELTMTEDDVTSYHNYIAKNGSVVAVAAGEKINERQAIEALMLPSANNMADSLAIWAFGSLQNYVTYANTKAKALGMHDSYFADASGFSPATVSTASDLVKLGEAAMKHEVLARIVGETTADIPVAGTIRNRNFLLGKNGNIGIKTGNTDEAGGVFLYAAKASPAGSNEPVTIVGAIMGAPVLGTAMNDSQNFSPAIADNITVETVIQAGDTVATYTAPWGQQIEAVALKNVSVLRWNGYSLQPELEMTPIDSKAISGQQVGTLSAKTSFNDGQTPVVLKGTFTPPSIWWRLTHPRF